MRSIGVDVGGSHIAAGLVVDGKVIAHRRVKFLSMKTKNDFLSALFSVIDSVKKGRISKIGIGFPSPILKGKVTHINNLPFLKGLDIKKEIMKKYNVPCPLENDANCFTLGEVLFGGGRGEGIVAGITLGTGIGCGIMAAGNMISGNSGSAGEIGEMPFKGKTFEEFASGRFLKDKKGNELGRTNKKKWKEFGDNLGKGLSCIVNTIDPSVIVLGGGIMKNYDLFEKSMKASLKKSTYEHTYSKLKIKKSRMKNASIIGAANLPSSL